MTDPADQTTREESVMNNTTEVRVPLGLVAELMEGHGRVEERIDRIELLTVAAERVIAAVRQWRDAPARDSVSMAAAEWGLLNSITDYEAAVDGEFDPRPSRG